MNRLKSTFIIAAVTTLAANAQLSKGTVFINKDVTTHIVCPLHLKIEDISTDNFIGNQSASNIVRIKPNI